MTVALIIVGGIALVLLVVILVARRPWRRLRVTIERNGDDHHDEGEEVKP